MWAVTASMCTAASSAWDVTDTLWATTVSVLDVIGEDRNKIRKRRQETNTGKEKSEPTQRKQTENQD